MTIAICGAFSQQSSAGFDIVMSLFGSPDETGFPNGGAIVIPIACTISQLYINCGTAPGIGLNVTVTLQKNNVDTALSVVITGNGTFVGSDLVNTISFVPGDLAGWHMAIDPTASATDVSCGALITFP
jgi:hypothetical protein